MKRTSTEKIDKIEDDVKDIKKKYKNKDGNNASGAQIEALQEEVEKFNGEIEKIKSGMPVSAAASPDGPRVPTGARSTPRTPPRSVNQPASSS